jgi:hypothetical protein
MIDGTHLWDQDLVALLDSHRYPLAIAIQTAGSNSEDLCFVQLLDGGFGQKDAAGGLGLSLDALDKHTIEKRGEGADGLECGRLGVVSKLGEDEQSDGWFGEEVGERMRSRASVACSSRRGGGGRTIFELCEED